jgi:hypothetical protein
MIIVDLIKYNIMCYLWLLMSFDSLTWNGDASAKFVHLLQSVHQLWVIG